MLSLSSNFMKLKKKVLHVEVSWHGNKKNMLT